jgi:hypothetical protein
MTRKRTDILSGYWSCLGLIWPKDFFVFFLKKFRPHGFRVFSHVSYSSVAGCPLRHSGFILNLVFCFVLFFSCDKKIKSSSFIHCWKGRSDRIYRLRMGESSISCPQKGTYLYFTTFFSLLNPLLSDTTSPSSFDIFYCTSMNTSYFTKVFWFNWRLIFRKIKGNSTAPIPTARKNSMKIAK